MLVSEILGHERTEEGVMESKVNFQYYRGTSTVDNTRVFNLASYHEFDQSRLRLILRVLSAASAWTRGPRIEGKGRYGKWVM